MAKIKIIPVSQIDEGIKVCKNKSGLLLKAAKKLYDCQFVDEAVIMYYYSVEELGKAIVLRNRKNTAISESKTDVDVSDFFYSHDEKINAVRNMAGSDIDIMEYNPIPEDGQFYAMTEKGPTIKDFRERSSVLLTDYDPNTWTWGKILPIPIAYQVEKAFTKLQSVLDNYK